MFELQEQTGPLARNFNRGFSIVSSVAAPAVPASSNSAHAATMVRLIVVTPVPRFIGCPF
ncbi:hypothetical protein F8A86_02675 [Betaproteobacteria bacterium SCN1]|nr:hypothetical protein F8A86_02675 [Betaproteobacteria bacterium SCN1]